MLAAAGCGEVSEKEFRSKVDAICKRSSAELQAIQPPPAADAAANARFSGQVVLVVRKTHDKLKAVEAPSKREADYDKWVGAYARILEVIARRRAAAEAGDARTFNGLVEQENTLLQENKARAALLGFTECAK